MAQIRTRRRLTQSHRRFGFARAAWCAGLLALGLGNGPAQAHRETGGGVPPQGAIVIPNLTHGQMRVIAAYQAAITDLADRQEPTDPTLRRLQGFIAIQRFACFWGLMPGSIWDESSPFNECAHAYLAATRALLVHLQTMPDQTARTGRLVTQIERDMLANDAALALCQYSDEGFNTADYVAPHWTAIASHPPTALTLGGVVSALLGGAVLLRQRGRSARPESGKASMPQGC